MSGNPSQWWWERQTTASFASQTGPQDISIAAEVLNQAQEVSDVPQIGNLRADQRVAEVDVANQDGSTDRVILVIQQQKSATQQLSSYPGDASFYDDCVSDYSHERAQSQASQLPRPSQQRRTSADLGRMPEILAANAAKAQATAPQSVFSAPLGTNLLFMPSGVTIRLGEWFKVLRAYTVKAAAKGKIIGSQSKAGLRQGAEKLRPVAAHLISIGRALVSELEKARCAARPSSSRGPQRPSKSRELHIRVIETDQQIDSTIPVLPRDAILVHDVRRRAAQTLPAMPPAHKVSRKPAPLPRDGPLGEIKLPQPREQQSSPAPRDPLGRKKVVQPMAVWKQAGYEPPPRACRPQVGKAVINPAYEVQSQHASLATVSMARSSISRSPATSPRVGS